MCTPIIMMYSLFYVMVSVQGHILHFHFQVDSRGLPLNNLYPRNIVPLSIIYD